MAIFHCNIKIISRAGGRSAVASAAYRAGDKILNKETGITHDFSRKRGVVYSEVILPEHTPTSLSDRAFLWNDIQKIEKRQDAQLAREIEIAIPREIEDKTKQIDLVRSYVQETFVSKGMIADINIHDKGDGNPHAHIMLSMREVDESGKWMPKQKTIYKLDNIGEKIPVIDSDTGEQKIGARGRRIYERITVQTNDWNDQSKAEEWRKAWADICNERLEEIGVDRIDHRSYKRQGLDIEPTIHEGYAARQIEAKGCISDRCEINREIMERRTLMIEIKAKITDVIDAIKQTLKERLEKIGGRIDGVRRVTTDDLRPGNEDRRSDKPDRGEEPENIAAFIERLDSAERASEEERTNYKDEERGADVESGRGEGLLGIIDAGTDYDPVGRDQIDAGIE